MTSTRTPTNIFIMVTSAATIRKDMSKIDDRMLLLWRIAEYLCPIQAGAVMSLVAALHQMLL